MITKKHIHYLLWIIVINIVLFLIGLQVNFFEHCMFQTCEKVSIEYIWAFGVEKALIMITILATMTLISEWYDSLKDK